MQALNACGPSWAARLRAHLGTQGRADRRRRVGLAGWQRELNHAGHCGAGEIASCVFVSAQQAPQSQGRLGSMQRWTLQGPSSELPHALPRNPAHPLPPWSSPAAGRRCCCCCCWPPAAGPPTAAAQAGRPGRRCPGCCGCRCCAAAAEGPPERAAQRRHQPSPPLCVFACRRACTQTVGVESGAWGCARGTMRGNFRQLIGLAGRAQQGATWGVVVEVVPMLAASRGPHTRLLLDILAQDRSLNSALGGCLLQCHFGSVCHSARCTRGVPAAAVTALLIPICTARSIPPRSKSGGPHPARSSLRCCW